MLEYVEKVILHPFPYLQNRLDLVVTMSMSPKIPIKQAFLEWCRFIELAAGMSNIKNNIYIGWPRDEKNKDLSCYFTGYRDRHLSLLKSPEKYEKQVTSFQERIRRIGQRLRWNIIDIATMQKRVDKANEKLHKQGAEERFGEIREMPNGGYGVWLNSELTGHVIWRKTPISQQEAIELVLQFACTKWWTVEEIEEFAEKPKNSRIFAKGMDEIGFRPSRRAKGQWARKKK